MSIFHKSWWHHHIKKWKAVGDIFGITGDLDREEKSLGRSAKNSYDHQAGQYEDGQKDDQNALRILAGSLTAASNAEADGEGDDE